MDASPSDNLKMSSIQERLQLKRVPLDTWNTREQLCLASAVVRSGDQNWMSVSRTLKTIGDPQRPADWYSQKSCAAQYGALLEHVDTPKRKKRNSEGAAETPQESILKRLTQERIEEIQQTVSEMTHHCQMLRNEISEVRNPATSDERIKELWSGIETARKTREKEMAKRAAWLREREERRTRSERQWRVPITSAGSPTVNNTSTSSATPSSPLLTSLLKSSPVVTTPQLIPHPASVVDTISPSAGAPTLSMLLEKTAPLPPHANKLACIEHIKSQLVQLEHQLAANPAHPPPVEVPDIDDIVLNTEDVYAFRDIDIPIHNNISDIHSKGHRSSDPKPFKKEDEDSITEMAREQQPEQIMKEPSPNPGPQSEETIDVEPCASTSESLERPSPLPVAEQLRIAFPEVKFPTPEIKIIQPDEVKLEPPPTTESSNKDEQEPMDITTDEQHSPSNPEPMDQSSSEPQTEAAETTTEAETTQTEADVSKLKQEELESSASVVQESPAETIPTVSEIPPADVAADIVPTSEPTTSEQITEEANQDIKTEIVDDNLETTLKDTPSSARGDEPDLETHTETDDDTPMELVREEEKDGKKKKDYSRKKKPDSRTCSGSESAAETSAPESPGSTDDKQHRLWKKSVMLVYNRLCAHKYASLFLRPITDDHAPGYSVLVKRPMDLGTIKKNIDLGLIRTTAEFQRDVLLMLSNALMYNSTEHRVYQMTQDMFKEAESQLGMLLAAQAHAGLPARTRRSRMEH